MLRTRMPKRRSNASARSGGQGRAAGQQRPHARDVDAIGRHRQQRRHHRRHRGQQRGFFALGKAPVALHEIGVAHAQQRGQHDRATDQKHRQAVYERTRDVIQRKAIDDHVALRRAVHAGRAGRRTQLVAVLVLRQLGAAGGAAGVKKRGHVVHRGADGQRRIALRGHGLIEIQRALGWRGRPDRQHVRQLRAAPPNARHARPDVQLGPRPQGHQHVHTGGLQQVGDVLFAQQVVDGAGDAHGFSPPQREVRLRNRRQQKGHARRLIAAERLKQARGAPDLGQELRIGPLLGRLVKVRALDVLERDAVRVLGLLRFQRVHHAGVTQVSLERVRLDPANVVGGMNGANAHGRSWANPTSSHRHHGGSPSVGQENCDPRGAFRL